MHIPETPGLFCEAIAREPGKLVIAGIVKTYHSPRDLIICFIICKEFHQHHAVKKKIIVGI